MTIAALLCIVALAAANAWSSVRQTFESYVVPGESYFLSLLRKEFFWRAFITNLSFGGVSVALAVIAMRSCWGRWDFDNPMFPLVLNFLMGIFAPYEIEETDQPPSLRAKITSSVAAVFFLYAAGVALWLYKETT